MRLNGWVKTSEGHSPRSNLSKWPEQLSIAINICPALLLDDAIVKTIIGVAHNLSLKAVADGVKSIAMADRLAQLRCDILQGSVFDKPLPVKEFELEYRI